MILYLSAIISLTINQTEKSFAKLGRNIIQKKTVEDK